MIKFEEVRINKNEYIFPTKQRYNKTYLTDPNKTL